jgi:two-component system, chemotaxis family, chemotaxis protein CheY
MPEQSHEEETTATGRILVVDDDPDIREVVSLTLEDEGYEVQSAGNGAIAMEHLQTWRPDVILLDMRMPVMDGWEFATRYRQTPGPHAPIVVITAAHDAAERAAQISADGAVAKPFNVDDLLKEVNRFTAPV